ncbi:hypothetical protein BGZ96_006528 [Linnemannia gamsii]|uniref:DUF4209 domain-containing protein n=1 Tax=Linnemannia gamsii TaxID=64522 RepID=A0ABQ7K274_9FUNG|nr:hypothetical protein BGZ96_006528 [Linnemannia gamsii]
MQQHPQQRPRSFIPPFVRELVYFDKTQYQLITSSSSSSTSNLDIQPPPPSTTQIPFEYISDNGLVILESIQTCLPASVVQSHIPTACRPEEFDPFRQGCVAVLSKLTRLLTPQQQNQGQDGSDSNNVSDTTKATKTLLNMYDVDGLGPWLGEVGRRATEVWFDAFVRGEYDQAWLVGSTVLEQLIVNIIYTLQGPEKFIPFLVRDLLSVSCLINSKSVDRTLIQVIKTLMGSPLTLNIRNLLWHGFVTPQDQIPLDAYGAMLIVTTMSIAVGVRRTMVEGLQIRYGGVPREERFYFKRGAEVKGDEKAGLERFDAVFERVAYRGDRLPLLISGSLEGGVCSRYDQGWDQVLAVLEAIVRKSSFVTSGTVHQWICALQHLQSASIGEPTAAGRSSFMFVMASLPLLEHGLRLIYVGVNGCKQDRTCALVAGEYYLTLDVILDEFVPPEYYDADAEELTRYQTNAIPNRLFSELGPQAMNLLHDLFLAALGPRLRDRTSHGENNIYFKTDIRTGQPWFDYYLGVVVFLLTLDSVTISKEYESVAAETRGWVRMYAERRFDEWSALRKETVRALCVILEYPRAVLQDVGSSKEGGVEAVNAIDNGDCPVVAEVYDPEWITLRLKPRLSVVFANEDTFKTKEANNLSTVQDRIMVCLSAWTTRPNISSTQNLTNKNKNEEDKDIQGMASNLPAWILIVQSVQAAANKVTIKMTGFLELQKQRQLSSRSRKQLECMKPLVPGWLGMLVGCLALIEHFVLLAEEEGEKGTVVALSGRKDENHDKGFDSVNGNGIIDNSNNSKKKNGKMGKGEEEKVAGTVVDKSSAAEIRLRLAIVQFLNKFVSNFERVKLPMIEAAWLDLVKSVDYALYSK